MKKLYNIMAREICKIKKNIRVLCQPEWFTRGFQLDPMLGCSDFKLRWDKLRSAPKLPVVHVCILSLHAARLNTYTTNNYNYRYLYS